MTSFAWESAAYRNHRQEILTLRSRYRPGSDPTHTGELQRTPPGLLVTKQNFEDFLLEL